MCSLMKTEKKDLRFQKTEKAIRSTFFALLQEEKLSDITVAEISRRALLGRGTFYLHYRDIYDLLHTVEQEYVEELGRILDEYIPFSEEDQIIHMTDHIFDYIHKNKEQLKLLFNHISTRHFTDELIDREKEIYRPIGFPDGNVKNLIKMTFLISGYAGVILDYEFHDSPHISENEVKQSLNAILQPFTKEEQPKGRGCK